MKLRVIQENNIVIITVLSLSERIEKLRQKRRLTELIREYLPNYIGVYLYSKKDNREINISNSGIYLNKSINVTCCKEFVNCIEAEKFCTDLKNSISLINHGTEVEITEVNNFIKDTNIFILE